MHQTSVSHPAYLAFGRRLCWQKCTYPHILVPALSNASAAARHGRLVDEVRRVGQGAWQPWRTSANPVHQVIANPCPVTSLEHGHKNNQTGPKSPIGYPSMLKSPLTKWLSLGAFALTLATPFAAGAAEQKSVAATAIVEHPALDSVRDGVRAALEQAGYSGDNLKWQYQTAQGNTATAAQIARKFVGDRPDAIVAIATPSAQAVVASTKSVPVVFAAVTDPVAAQLVRNWEPSGSNVTGVSDELELDRQMELVKRVIPDARRVGMVYNPGEANSVVVVERLRELLPEMGMTLVEAAAPRSVDVGSAARSLVGKVDVIYTNTDNNVVSAYESLVKVGMDTKTPLIASDTDSVKRGAIAALGIDYYQHGIQAGELVVRLLKGEEPGSIAPQKTAELSLFINRSAAAAQGVTLSQELIDSAAEVIE